MKAKIHVTLKPGVLDPQGKAIANALHHLGFSGVEEVTQGKYFEITLKAGSRAEAEAALEEMCKKLLANTVVENYRVEIE